MPGVANPVSRIRPQVVIRQCRVTAVGLRRYAPNPTYDSAVVDHPHPRPLPGRGEFMGNRSGQAGGVVANPVGRIRPQVVIRQCRVTAVGLRRCAPNPTYDSAVVDHPHPGPLPGREREFMGNRLGQTGGVVANPVGRIRPQVVIRQCRITTVGLRRCAPNPTYDSAVVDHPHPGPLPGTEREFMRNRSGQAGGVAANPVGRIRPQVVIRQCRATAVGLRRFAPDPTYDPAVVDHPNPCPLPARQGALPDG